MLRTREVQKTVSEVEDIVCNMCGKSCKGSAGSFEGLIEVQVCGGYGSCLGDGVAYHFSICDNCLKDLFPLFRIPPLTSDRDPWSEGYVQEEWKETKK